MEARVTKPSVKPSTKRRGPALRDPERTRAAILAAATVEFTGRGLDGARVDSIAKRSGVNKRMIYHYFGGKEGLYVEVLETTYAAIRHAEVGLGFDEREPAEGMRELVAFTWGYFIQHPEFLGLLGTENLHKAAYLKKSQRIRDLHSPLIGMIQTLLERGVKQGIFRKGVDPMQLYITIASLGFFYMSNRHTLSTIFGENLSAPDRLEARGQHFAEVVRSYRRP